MAQTNRVAWSAAAGSFSNPVVVVSELVDYAVGHSKLPRANASAMSRCKRNVRRTPSFL